MARAKFDPGVDGFAFPNHWEFDDTEKEIIREHLNTAITAVGFVLLGPLALAALGQIKQQVMDDVNRMLIEPYGLCGGMAFAALDYLREHKKLPRGRDGQDIPLRDGAEGEQLREYLWERLLDSLLLNLPRFVAWMIVLHHIPENGLLRGGAPWLAKRTQREFRKLKRHIDMGSPWPLGIVGTTENPTLNHQVLACGYQVDKFDGRVTIEVYDPNCPGTLSTIRMTLTDRHIVNQVESCGPGARGPIQGFFCETYLPILKPLPDIKWG